MRSRRLWQPGLWCRRPYHIWEKYQENGWGVETNVRHRGYNEDITGSYEDVVIQVMKTTVKTMFRENQRLMEITILVLYVQ